MHTCNLWIPAANNLDDALAYSPGLDAEQARNFSDLILLEIIIEVETIIWVPMPVGGHVVCIEIELLPSEWREFRAVGFDQSSFKRGRVGRRHCGK